jgi:hypothetical protein
MRQKASPLGNFLDSPALPLVYFHQAMSNFSAIAIFATGIAGAISIPAIRISGHKPGALRTGLRPWGGNVRAGIGA